MYCILQGDELGTVSIIGFLKDPKKLKSKIVKLIGNKYNHRMMDQISFEQIKNNSCFESGHYLLNNGEEIQLVLKTPITKGKFSFCSLQYFTTNNIFLWKLVSYQNKINRNAIITLEATKEYSPLYKQLTSEEIEFKENKQLTFEERDFKENIQEFHLEDMLSYSHSLIVGRRGTGKTYLIIEMLNHILDLNKLLIIDPIERMIGQYHKTFPGAQIEYDFSFDIVEKFIDSCKKDNSDGTHCIIIDNCIGSRSFDSDQFHDLLKKAQEHNIYLIATIQYPLGDFGEMFDYVFICQEDTYMNQKKMFEKYGIACPSLGSFIDILHETTRNYGKLIIDNRQEKVFKYLGQ